MNLPIYLFVHLIVKQRLIFYLPVQEVMEVSGSFYADFLPDRGFFRFHGIRLVLQKDPDLCIGEFSIRQTANPELRFIKLRKYLPQPVKKTILQIIYGLVYQVPIQIFLTIDNFIEYP